MAEILLLGARNSPPPQSPTAPEDSPSIVPSERITAPPFPPIEAPSPEREKAPGQERARTGGLDVLVVDDDPLVCALISDVLSLRGHRVTVRTDGQSAWQDLQSRAYPLVVLDWLLPGLDGLELCRHIRELPGGAETVVMIITARDRPEHLQAVLQAGANDYLPKPFDLASLEVRLSIAERHVAEIAERRRVDAALAHMALHDPLTDLPNRVLLRDRLHQAILTAQRVDRSFALLLMDQDRFKEVNDTLGHHVGDLLLQQVAQRLRESVRASDTVARLGGDEFALVLPGADTEGATQAALKLLRALEDPFVLDGQRLEVRASIGIAIFPPHGADAETLLRRADVAMYTAKRSGSGYAIYSSDQEEQLSRGVTLVTELRRALEEEELVLHYQPKMDLKKGVVSAVEALVRWQHPERGLLLPDQFIPLAERTGLIQPLSRWVLNAALRQWHLWAQHGLELVVAVNLSARNLQDLELPDLIAELLRRWRVPATSLRLEITETALLTDAPRALAVLERIRTLGVPIAIDDFGTGYSSLAYLKRLPVQQIKIDRSFVQDMAVDDNDLAIVRATIELGHNLGLDVVAEGVEDQATWDLLARLGCDAAQGYYLSYPVPAGELERWMEARPPA